MAAKWIRVCGVDSGTLLGAGLVARMVVLYVARSVDDHGVLAVSDGPLPDAVGRAVGAGPFDRRALARALDDALGSGCIVAAPRRVSLPDWGAWTAPGAAWVKLDVGEPPHVARAPFWTRVVRSYVDLRWGAATAEMPPEELADVLARFGASRPERAMVADALADAAKRKLLTFADAVRVGRARPPRAPGVAPKVTRSRVEPAAGPPPVGVDGAAALPPVGAQPVAALSWVCLRSASAPSRTCLHCASNLPPLCVEPAPTTVPSVRNSTTDVSRTHPHAGASEETESKRVRETEGTPHGGWRGEVKEQGTFSFAAEPEKAPARKAKRQGRADTVPEVGHAARPLYDAIVAHTQLAGIVHNPGDFAITVQRANPDVPAGEIVERWNGAGDWIAREGSVVTEGRQFLRNQIVMLLKRRSRRVAAGAAAPTTAPRIGAVGAFSEATALGAAVPRSPLDGFDAPAPKAAAVG